MHKWTFFLTVFSLCNLAWPKDPAPLAVWHFDEGKGTWGADSGEQQNDAAIHGAKWVPGLFGAALQQM